MKVQRYFIKIKFHFLNRIQLKVDLKKIDLKNISEKDIREINYLFAGSVKHYWPKVNLFEFLKTDNFLSSKN